MVAVPCRREAAGDSGSGARVISPWAAAVAAIGRGVRGCSLEQQGARGQLRGAGRFSTSRAWTAEGSSTVSPASCQPLWLLNKIKIHMVRILETFQDVIPLVWLLDWCGFPVGDQNLSLSPECGRPRAPPAANRGWEEIVSSRKPTIRCDCERQEVDGKTRGEFSREMENAHKK